jgi:hypothetical protein
MYASERLVFAVTVDSLVMNIIHYRMCLNASAADQDIHQEVSGDVLECADEAKDVQELWESDSGAEDVEWALECPRIIKPCNNILCI